MMYLPELMVPGQVLGSPGSNDLSPSYLIAYESTEPDVVDILAVDAGMTERGWAGTQCVQPVAIHLFIDGSHSPATAEDYCNDLRMVVELVRAGEIKRPTTTTNVLGVYTRD